MANHSTNGDPSVDSWTVGIMATFYASNVPAGDQRCYRNTSICVVGHVTNLRAT